MRAFAAVSVTIFHLSLGNRALFTDKSIFTTTTGFGYLGVEIFFILSGYVICYSLPANYNYSNTTSFLAKRIVRIYPAYLISILLVIILNSLSHYITNIENHLSIIDLLSNIFFLTNLGFGNYLNVVYWTLGLEIQFYLLIALSFMFINNSYKVMLYLIILLILSSLPKIHNMDLVFPNLSVFSIGILTFFYKIKRTINLKIFLILSVITLIHIYFFLGIAVLLASCICLLILLFWTKTNGFIKFFSNISFSLYLIHVTIGGKVINLGLRYVSTLQERYLLFMSSFIISIFLSYIFYLLIEKPTLLWSKKITYKKNVTT
ncbi:peptidoglycan/LPS O-acetylase OafA/YrhL [Pedobacter psychrotolerans]|uniref:Peptidoglycan/LPS O-acetylase OafA/YrhL n=1 Tax=Pedobacter psychrotolerans TaxID=1843235 RepID=A0A4R2HQ32_9SPHI|nr:peptidoglycan/LPS O-acetylase OafA/YrhL [Pedobacter psychrotolerans]